jgi:mitochondrial import receptor subunit TOM70
MTSKNELIKEQFIKNNTNNISSENSYGSKLIKLALAIGIPSTVFIIGYLLFKKYKKSSKINDNDNDKLINNNNNKEIKQVNDNNNELLTSLEKAIDIKNKGNKYFQQNKYMDALECYTNAINLCPLNDTNELPKFYQNRAAVYEQLVIII